MPKETVRVVIVDSEDPDKTVSVVESSTEAGVYGIVILAPDGSDL